jgi:transposase
MTCWRRLHEWMQAGVWQSVHEAILRSLREHDQIMWDRASVDAASVPAPFGGEHTGRNPTDRGKLGCKHHVLVDQRGLPLVARISGAQVHDSRLLIPLVEAIPAIKGLSGRAQNAQVSFMPIEPMLHEHIGLATPTRDRSTDRTLRSGITRKSWLIALGR